MFFFLASISARSASGCKTTALPCSSRRLCSATALSAWEIAVNVARSVRDASGDGKRESCLTSLEVCQSIQDAIDVLKFAMERDDAR